MARRRHGQSIDRERAADRERHRSLAVLVVSTHAEVSAVEEVEVCRVGEVVFLRPGDPARDANRVGQLDSQISLRADGHVARESRIVESAQFGQRRKAPVVVASGFEVVGVDSNAPIHSNGSLHCISHELNGDPMVIEAATAAITWTHEQAVQIVVDEQAAAEAVSDQQVEVMFTVDNPAGPADIRVIKIASTDTALPGDIIDFTIRLDNLGGKPVGNVTLVDNLTTRLEYVEGSAQSSLEAKFTSEENAGGSLLLRWDFGEPLVAQDGGLVRFKCRVR